MPDLKNFPITRDQNPAANARAVIPADADLSGDYFTRAVYVGGTGDLTVQMADEQGVDTYVTFYAVPAGSLLPIAVNQIRATDTTATFIVAVW